MAGSDQGTGWCLGGYEWCRRYHSLSSQSEKFQFPPKHEQLESFPSDKHATHTAHTQRTPGFILWKYIWSLNVVFYFVHIFNNIISQVPRLEAVEDVQRQHPDSAGHTQAALLHRQVSISAGAPQNNVPIWDIHQHPGLSSTHHQYPRAGLQILITSGNFNSPLSFAPGPDIYICRDGAISYNFSPRYYSRYVSC